jgi:hypothetical protein
MKKKMVRRFTLSIGVLSIVKALQHHSHYLSHHGLACPDILAPAELARFSL